MDQIRSNNLNPYVSNSSGEFNEKPVEKEESPGPVLQGDTVEVGAGDSTSPGRGYKVLKSVAKAVGGAIFSFYGGARGSVADKMGFLNTKENVVKKCRTAVAIGGLAAGLAFGTSVMGPVGIILGPVLGSVLGAGVGQGVPGFITGTLASVIGGVRGMSSGWKEGNVKGENFINRLYKQPVDVKKQ